MLKKSIHKSAKILIGLIIIIIFFQAVKVVARKQNEQNEQNNADSNISQTEETDSFTYDKNIDSEIMESISDEGTEEVFENGFQFKEDERVYIGDYTSFVVPSGFEKENSDGDAYLYGKKQDGNIVYYLYCYTEDQYQQNPDDIMEEHGVENKTLYGEGEQSTVAIGNNEWKRTVYNDDSFVIGYSFVMYECVLNDQYIKIGFATSNDYGESFDTYAPEVLETIRTDF